MFMAYISICYLDCRAYCYMLRTCAVAKTNGRIKFVLCMMFIVAAGGCNESITLDLPLLAVVETLHQQKATGISLS
jgi:hypothetical protein